jgi:hypothetical protein
MTDHATPARREATETNLYLLLFDIHEALHKWLESDENYDYQFDGEEATELSVRVYAVLRAKLGEA